MKPSRDEQAEPRRIKRAVIGGIIGAITFVLWVILANFVLVTDQHSVELIVFALWSSLVITTISIAYAFYNIYRHFRPLVEEESRDDPEDGEEQSFPRTRL